MKHQKAMDYIYIYTKKKRVNQALLSNRASCLIKQRVFASNGGAEVNIFKKKELTKLCLVTGPLASISRECSRQTVELKLISLKKKKE